MSNEDKKSKIYQEHLIESMVKKYHNMNIEDATKIVNAFVKHIKSELINGNEVDINNFGTFTSKLTKPVLTRTVRGNKRWSPEYIRPYFRTNRKFRKFINTKEN